MRRVINHALLLSELHRLSALPIPQRPAWLSPEAHEALVAATERLAADVRRLAELAPSLSALARELDVSDKVPDEFVRRGILPPRKRGGRTKGPKPPKP